MKAMISIILPVYNAEKYLNECIGSIVKQSYDNYELIIINDGSSDQSEKIIKEYTNNAKVKYVRQTNSGVASARNAAISMAIGKYIIFVDADDVLPCDSLEKRVEFIQEADLLIGSYEVTDEQGKNVGAPMETSVDRLSVEDVLKMLFLASETGYQGYLWNKLFKTDIIKKNNILFDENVFFGEDRLFIAQYLMCCVSVNILNDIVYKYRVNSTSAMSMFQDLRDENIDRLKTEFIGYEKLRKILNKYDRNIYEICLKSEMNTIISFIRKSSNAPLLKNYCVGLGRKNLGEFLRCKTENVLTLEKLKTIAHLLLKR